MPENLRVLKGRIRTAKNIAQLAKTLEMVSVSKIRRARALAETVRPYAERITALTGDALRGLSPEERSHPYLRAGKSGGESPGKAAGAGAGKAPQRILLAIGPDKGLCGPLTGNIARKLAESMDENTRLITVGKRMEAPGVRLAGDRLVASFMMGARLPSYSLVFQLVRVINELMLPGQAATLDVLYSRFVSYFSQVPTLQHVLPLGAPAEPGAATAAPPVIEPTSATLLEALLPHFLEVLLFDAVVQAFSAEHAARMVAMQNAKANALEIADTFTLLYNKTRQERITSEILDLGNKGKKK
ncbi:MAG: FoF1 ATP synthase subunit gamma [Spirochaetia bacterium]|jgi:F-type H+-transporting ATPase subunit gamma